NMDDQEAFEEAKRLVEMTRLPIKGASKLERKQFQSLHCKSRFRLTAAIIRRGNLEEAEKVLASVDEESARTTPNGTLRMAQLHCSLANQFISRKQIKKAGEHCRSGQRYLNMKGNVHDQIRYDKTQKELTRLNQSLLNRSDTR
ncbi:MAG: hypothetical protein K2Z81_22225, partial [Cyanobacteria bacterium]|nr:hypothetical protein [Cyanobacteriota bacterium]